MFALDADSGIVDFHTRQRPALPAFHNHIAAGTGILDRVLREVAQNTGQEGSVAQHHRIRRLDLQADIVSDGTFSELATDCNEKQPQRYRTAYNRMIVVDPDRAQYHVKLAHQFGSRRFTMLKEFARRAVTDMSVQVAVGAYDFLKLI